MSGKKRIKWLLFIVLGWILLNVLVTAGIIIVEFSGMKTRLEEERVEMLKIQGVNEDITGQDYDRELAVRCDNGIFVGLEENGVRSYRGIAYALPPVGELRWKEPVDAPESDRVREAYYYGKSGIQTEADSERASLYLMGEDCLTLNVWTDPEVTAEDGGKKPVMVFFPGGAYGWGGTADPIYDGQNFVEAHRDVVLVTANYRIGLMGFMDFSEVEGGENYEKSGNLGLLDSVSALRWVQRNIAQFGGDPDNVTVFGESAGGSTVSFLPLMDEAKGLFKRAIAESGSPAFSYSREEAKTLTEKLLEETGARNMQDLLALTEEELIAVNESLNDYNNFPERDGIVLPEDVFDAYAAGAASDVEMLIGTNADEARYWINEMGGVAVYRMAAPLLYDSIVGRLDREDRRYADAFLALQDSREDVWNMTEFFNDLIFRVPAIRQASLHSETGGTTYMYYWTKESEREYFGACHAVELAYVFNNLDDTIFTGAPADPEIARTVQEMWVNFAKTGDPSTEEYHWDPYDTTSRKTMIIGEKTELASDPMPEQRVLVEPLMKYRINGYYRMVDYAFLYLRKRIVRDLLILLAANAVIAGAVLIRKLIRRKKKSALPGELNG